MEKMSEEEATKNLLSSGGSRSSVWEVVPEDVEDRILGMLPAMSMLRLRRVCRSWNAILSRARQQRPWLLLCTRGLLASAFDPSADAWIALPRPIPPSPEAAEILAVSGPLVCAGNQFAECRTLTVYNPLIRCLRTLPPTRTISLIHRAAMVADGPAANSYKIVLAGEAANPVAFPHRYELFTELYDSGSDSWHSSAPPPADAKLATEPGAWVGETYYCMTEMPYGLLAFHVATGDWRATHTVMPEGLRSPALAACGRTLFMIGRRAEPRACRVVIWELDQGADTWTEALRLPSDVAAALTAGGPDFYTPFICAGAGEHEIYVASHQVARVLVCDVAGKSWRWLPTEPFVAGKRDLHLLGFTFGPRFDSRP